MPLVLTSARIGDVTCSEGLVFYRFNMIFEKHVHLCHDVAVTCVHSYRGGVQPLTRRRESV